MPQIYSANFFSAGKSSPFFTLKAEISAPFGKEPQSMSKTDHYKSSGVDIEKADRLADWLKTDKPSQATNKGGSVVAGIGGFASLFRPDFSGMADPLLVSGTDGVGTKLLLGLEHDALEDLGVDLVAMCVNDIYTLGARALFFIDYYATGALDEAQFRHVLTGIKKGLAEAECALIGGETAELPGLYEKGHFDLAGFVVGAVDGAKLPKPEHVQAGDVLIGLASNGFHSNGYSLIRKWLAKPGFQPDAQLIERLLRPTRIYAGLADVFAAAGPGVIHGAAHITGGGMSGNLVRVLPAGLTAQISLAQVPTQDWVKDFILANVPSLLDVENSFNLGCGMILAVAKEQESAMLKALADYDAVTIGEVVQGASPAAPAAVTFV